MATKKSKRVEVYLLKSNVWEKLLHSNKFLVSYVGKNFRMNLRIMKLN